MTRRQTGVRLSTAMVLAVAAISASAETITLTSKEGGVQITGELVSYDGTSYVIDSILGRNRIDAAAVTCDGPGCPGDEISFNASVAVIDQPAAVLLHSLLTGFAAGRDLGITREGNNDILFAYNLTQGDAVDAGRIDAARQPQDAAFEALLSGEIDFLVSTRTIDNATADAFVARGLPDLRDAAHEKVVALDAIVPLVHPSNPVRAITLPEFGEIAAGRISNWNELGGPDAPIRVILPAEDSAIAAVFEDRIVRPNRLRVQRGAERASEADARTLVAEDRNAITLASAALADAGRPVPVQLACGPVALPNAFAVKSEEYPLSRRMVIYTNGNLSPAAQEFLAYATSAAAQAQIAETGFVDQNVESMPVALQGTRLASAILSMEGDSVISATRALVENLASAERLSTTFRFTAGSERLDNKALRDVERMADYLIADGFEKREILLFGFTDNVGRSDLNQRLALERAESVRQAILASAGGQIAPEQIRASSYGSIAPVGCNETIEGRASNRRVEVWVR